ncbi:hypothetical protein [Neobacillus vireti]|uniref:hypothetical protein n=1 Tax=Neobacillus vireti TaxID=220686 RepID=UPI002FFE6761
MKYSAIIFDLDGVVCHTDQYHYIARKEIADDKLNIQFDEKINNRLRGVAGWRALTSSLKTILVSCQKKKKPCLSKKK